MTELYGRDLLTTQEWSLDELEATLGLATAMKRGQYAQRYLDILKHKTFLMLFYNTSTRTRQSFEVAMTELGGHAIFIEPKSMRLKTAHSSGESAQDTANVMSRYGHGIGIRILEDQVERYGDGNKLLREYAKHASVPVINMADDMYHPCQGLADVMTLRERIKKFEGKKFVQVWGYSSWVRSWCSVHESLLINTRFGMDVTLAYPKGYDLDQRIIERAKANARETGSEFAISHDIDEAYDGAHVIYSRNWMSPKRYASSMETERELAQKHGDWRATPELMDTTANAYVLHCMPADRGNEGTDEVFDSARCVMYDEAENRLHTQKAVLAQVMGER